MSMPAPLWRLLLILSAVLASQAGRLHPDAPAEEPLRSELAIMTADDAWVPAHVLMLGATVLLALGRWGALRSEAFAAARTSVKLAAIAMTLFAVESVFHLAAVVDSDALASGESAPVAMTHVVLGAILYPLSGLAIASLSLRLAQRWTGARRLVAVPGIVGGLIHAVTVPLTLLLPDAGWLSWADPHGVGVPCTRRACLRNARRASGGAIVRTGAGAPASTPATRTGSPS